MEAIKPHFLPLFLGIFGLGFVIFGIYQIIGRDQKEPSTLTLEKSAQAESKDLIVDVEGAVIQPGVYSLPPDARYVDALAKASGLSEEADRGYVEKNINMAAKITDGLKIYVPRVGEVVSTSDGQASVLNVNTASQGDLEALPGIGPATAKKIIEARPFSSVDELLSKSILGPKVFEEIKDKLSAN